MILLAMVLIIGITGCGYEETVDDQQAEQTEQIMRDLNAQVGLPDISNGYEKKLAKDIYELRDDSSLVTYAYTTNLEGRYVYLGACIGYGLPYSVQYSNPEVITQRSSTYGTIAMPQAEPNGLFMPDGLSATWLIMINEVTGDREIVYSEPSIVVTQSKLPRRLVAEWSLPENY